ncbi:hypothetical protein M0R72_15870 [Candidatus Pacearchaeota archaeon]|jgi:hypothetical protein|nr:hypothetical protein [Candidatus Pacearchaeota archaeon]
MRHREEIIEDILDRIDQIFTEAMPSDEQQIKQSEYIIPAEPLDEIMLILIPELEEIEQE